MGNQRVCGCMAVRHSRRRVLSWVGVLPTLVVGWAGWAAAPARAAGQTEVLLLSCMDYRLMDDVARYMESRGLREKYDHVVLAGASLGAVNDRFPAWRQTFWQHVDLAVQLHRIERVVVMDHRDCGAYRMLVGADHAKTPASETAAHAQVLGTLRHILKERHPHLAVETLLMGLDGTVEAVA